MNEATLLRTGDRPILRFERHLPRPIEEVWRAVTEPEQLKAWFPTRIEIDEWKVGAQLTHHFDDHDIDPLSGEVLECDPPRRLSFTWGTDTISYTLVPGSGGGTTFVLTEELGASIAARNAAGWESCLDRLVDGDDGGEWQPRFERYVAEFEPVLGLQEGPPAVYRERSS
ncbi:MAG: SRPBCC family protein [Acidimicrobiales bacterium]